MSAPLSAAAASNSGARVDGTRDLPDGFRVRIDPHYVRTKAPRHLVGGSPLRLLTLSPAAANLVDDAGAVTVRCPHSRTLARRLLDAGLAHPLVDRDGAQPHRDARDAVTVVIPVRDNQTGLDRLLAALDGHRVIVVDDGSDVPLQVPVSPLVTLYRSEINHGPASARNTGAAQSNTDLIAFLDSDTVPEPGWSGRLAAHFDDPTVALAAPRITGLTATVGGSPARRTRPVAVYADRYSSLDMGPRAASVHPGNPVSYVPSAAMVVRRSAFAAVGGFDERLRVAEDVDLCWRVCAAGWSARYEPAAHVGHDHRTRLRALLDRRRFYGTGAAELAARHGAIAAPVVMSAPIAVGVAGVLSGTRVGHAAALGACALTFHRLRTALAVVPDRNAVAARNVLRAAWFGTTLGAASLLRHHWPVSAALALVWPAFRRRLIRIAVAEAAVSWIAEVVREPAARHPDPISWAVLHRLDDLAYGAGVWQGALSRRSARALRPVIGSGR